jgi:L-threonylcarbamoyladenylate synthase
MQRFKRRKGPFLLLAASRKDVCRLVPYFSPLLRKMMHQVWPGPVTLVFAAKPGMPDACYQRGCLAVRFDADAFCSMLAQQCGGFILSSSLNRRDEETVYPDRRLRMRWHRHLQGCVNGHDRAGIASRIYRIDRSRMQRIR